MPVLVKEAIIKLKNQNKEKSERYQKLLEKPNERTGTFSNRGNAMVSSATPQAPPKTAEDKESG